MKAHPKVGSYLVVLLVLSMIISSNSLTVVAEETVFVYSYEIELGASYSWIVERMEVEDPEDMSDIDAIYDPGSVIELTIIKQLPNDLTDSYFVDEYCCYTPDYVSVKIDGENFTEFSGNIQSSVYLFNRGNFLDNDFSIRLSLVYPILSLNMSNEVETLADDLEKSTANITYYDEGDKLIYTGRVGGWFINQTIDLSSGFVTRSHLVRDYSFCCIDEGNATFSLDMLVTMVPYDDTTQLTTDTISSITASNPSGESSSSLTLSVTWSLSLSISLFVAIILRRKHVLKVT